MALSNFEEKNLAKAWNNEAPTKAASMWVQLHTGDPGEDCTANVATENERRQITLDEIANGEWTNENVLEWAEVAATEEVSHVSVWDAEAAGNPRVYGALVGKEKLTAGKDARIKAEQLNLALT
jgi:hypothetical protein